MSQSQGKGAVCTVAPMALLRCPLLTTSGIIKTLVMALSLVESVVAYEIRAVVAFS